MEFDNKTNFIGNGSTFIKYLAFLIAGKVVAIAVAHGINLPIGQYVLAEIIGYILGIIGATIDAKYHNNINWQVLNKILGFNQSAQVQDAVQSEFDEITFADTGKYPENSINGDGDEP